MGIIVNENFEDSRGFTSIDTYVSFSDGMNIKKRTRYFNVEISQEDASGNPNASSVIEAVQDASGNRKIDSSGNMLTKIVYKELRTKDVYFVLATLVHFKDKQSRLENKQRISEYKVTLDVELTEFANIFSKLYEKVKSDKTLFPYTNLTDDL